MASLEYLSDFELLVMLAVMRLEDRAYGVTIRQAIHEHAGRDVSFGAVYSTLERLQAKGFLRSGLGEPTAERGGKSRRFYRPTAAGKRVLVRSGRSLRQMMAGLDLEGSAA